MGARDLMNGGFISRKEVRTRRARRTTECSDVSKVADEIDEGPPVGVAASRLESRIHSSLYTRMAYAMSNGCLFQNARSSVDRSSILDTNLSTRDADIYIHTYICTCFMLPDFVAATMLLR